MPLSLWFTRYNIGAFTPPFSRYVKYEDAGGMMQAYLSPEHSGEE